MKVLVLTCSTGGGHNAAANYITNELLAHNIPTTYQNYLALYDKKTQNLLENAYYKSLAHNGFFFKNIYKLGEIYNKTNITSPVYLLNKIGRKKLEDLINQEQYDLCICTHLYPALALTAIKKEKDIHFLFIATDYKCIPFTNEINPDYFIIPSTELKSDYLSFNIPEEKLIPLGIPVDVTITKTKNEIIKELELSYPKNILIMSGSMGFGNLKEIVTSLLNGTRNTGIIIICGNNDDLYLDLKTIKDDRLKVLGFINNFKEYAYVCDVLLSKPGGLATTEIAALRKPLIHITPIPGVETYNANFFQNHHMSLVAKTNDEVVNLTNTLLNNPDLQTELTTNLAKYINNNSVKDLYNFIITTYK